MSVVLQNVERRPGWHGCLGRMVARTGPHTPCCTKLCSFFRPGALAVARARVAWHATAWVCVARASEWFGRRVANQSEARSRRVLSPRRRPPRVTAIPP
jgi:hypothetical protein